MAVELQFVVCAVAVVAALPWHCGGGSDLCCLCCSLQAASELRIMEHMDSIVASFNEVLKVGLGEVKAKYDISMPDWLTEWNVQSDGKSFS